MNFLVIFFLLSPGLSFVSLITGFYFPNDKIVHIFALGLSIFRGKINRIILKRASIFFVAMGTVFLVRYILFQNQPTSSDINLLVTYSLLPFTALLFTSSKSFLNALVNYAVFASFWAAAQQILMNFGSGALLQAMLTYPSQVEGTYIFSPWAPLLYRVPGFQLESSQFSFMLCVVLALMSIRTECFNRKKATLFVASIIANGSTAGFGGLLILVISLRSLGYRFLLYVFPVVLFLILVLLSYGLLETQIDKVRLLFELLRGVSDANINSDRVLGLFGVFDLITFSDLFLGLGLEFRGGHDFFSLMIVGIGISGVGVLFTYFVSFYSKGNILLLTLLFFYAISNGSLLDPIYHAVFLYFILTYLERTDGGYHNYHGNKK